MKGRAARRAAVVSLIAVVLSLIAFPSARFEYDFSSLEPEYRAYYDQADRISPAFPSSNRRNPAYLIVDDPADVRPLVDELRRRFRITAREAQVALLMAERLTHTEIAIRLGISPNTARRHSERVLGKLGIHSRIDLAETLEDVRQDVGWNAAPGPLAGEPDPELPEVTVRWGVRSEDAAMVERFTREIAPLVLSGPPSVTGFAGGRPRVQEVVAYWPALIPKSEVRVEVG